MSLADKNIFISFFSICGLFISSSCLITLARVSRMILKSVAGGDYPCLVHDLCRKASNCFFP